MRKVQKINYNQEMDPDDDYYRCQEEDCKLTLNSEEYYNRA